MNKEVEKALNEAYKKKEKNNPFKRCVVGRKMLKKKLDKLKEIK